MKRIELTIKEDGNYTIDLAEGFSGQSCAQKAQNIISLIGGAETKSQVKPEYYNPDGDNLNELFTNK
jgi:hypothetical protein